jgi:hypothetical protein
LWGWTFKNSGGQDANALACDDKGNVYVSWLEASVTSHLTKLTPTGEIIWDKTFGTSHGGFVDPSIFQVCCDKAGNVFASIFSSTGPSLVKAFKPNGDNLWTANFNGVTGNHRIPGKFIAGYSYAVPSVLKINSGTGEIAWSMGVDAFFLEGVDIAFDGSIYAILNSDPGYSVRCYNPDGSVRYTVLVASGNSSIPFSDNIVASGKFWMVPFGTHFVNEELGDYDVYSVKVFNQSDGSLVTTIPWGTSYPSSQNLGVDIIWSLGRP